MNLKTIGDKLGLTGIIIFLMILTVSSILFAAGYMAYNSSSGALSTQENNSLQQIADIKEVHLLQLIELRLEQAKEFAGSTVVRDLDSSGFNSPEVTARIQRHIDQVNEEMALEHDNKYEDIDRETEIESIEVLDKNGNVVAATNGDRLGKKSYVEILATVKERSAYFAGMERDNSTGKEVLTYLHAVRDAETGDFAGVVVLQTGTESVDAIVNNRMREIGETGQTYIINKDYMMITRSRFDDNSAFTQRVENDVIRACIENREEFIGNYVNYLGNEVGAATMAPSDLDWCIVIEKDQEEIIAASVALKNQMFQVGLIILAISIVAAYFISILIGNFVRRPLRAAVEQINSAANQLSSTTQQSAAAAQQNSSIAQQVAAGASEQSEKAEEVSKSVSDMAAAIQQMTASSMEASAAALETSKLAQDTGEKGDQSKKSLEEIKHMVSGTADMIRGMSDKSRSIGEIVETITSIAEQTNLLALNAAIEAARAGDAGRGFAVVADEVRKLAEGSGKAAEEIKGRIKDMLDQIDDSVVSVESGVKKADEGAKVINETLSNLHSMSAAIQQVTAKIQEVTAGVGQQSAAVQQVAKSMDSIAAISEQNSSGAQQLSASAQQQSSANQQISAAAQQLQALSDELAVLAGGMEKHTKALNQAKKPIMIAHEKIEEVAKIASVSPRVAGSSSSSKSSRHSEPKEGVHKITND